MKFWQVLLLSLCVSIAFSEPPREIPEELMDRYTLNRTIPVLYKYLNNSYPSVEPLFYSKSTIDAYIKKVKQHEVNYYGPTDTWLYEALEKYPIRDKDVVIIGSSIPWYESIVLAYGGRPTTIEYNTIDTDDDRIKVLTVEEFNKTPRKFDVLISISSIEHDGLGRYGDPLNPEGDLEFMATAKERYLNEGGCMIIAFPVGSDCLVWNAHRIYGTYRLPLLIEKWNTINTFGFNIDELQRSPDADIYQPVFYLSPK